MRNFRELNVWERSHRLALETYRITRSFPTDERFGLTSQLRRAAASVPANIAEGCGRSTEPDLARFCDIAMGSATETEYHLLLAHDLQYIPTEVYEKADRELDQIKRMLNRFTQHIRKNC